MDSRQNHGDFTVSQFTKPESFVGSRMMGILLGNAEYDGPAGESSARIDSRGKPTTDPVFDGWLTHHLSKLYDPVVNEPIPAELLRLLEERLG